MIDEKTLFSALYGELNARVSARTTANTAHMQTIAIFASASVVAMIGAETTVSGMQFGSPIYYFLAGFMPLISFYFLSIYDQHDRQIGLLNRHLRKIEEKSQIENELKFFTRRAETGLASFGARFQAHFAITALGCSSLLIFSFAHLNDALPNAPTWRPISFFVCVMVTLINFTMMVRLELFRRWLIRPDEKSRFWDFMSKFVK